MTEQELAKIFDEAGKELAAEFDVSKLEAEFTSRFGTTRLTAEDAEKISAAINVVNQMNQKFLFRVLVKLLCNR